MIKLEIEITENMIWREICCHCHKNEIMKMFVPDAYHIFILHYLISPKDTCTK